MKTIIAMILLCVAALIAYWFLPYLVLGVLTGELICLLFMVLGILVDKIINKVRK